MSSYEERSRRMRAQRLHFRQRADWARRGAWLLVWTAGWFLVFFIGLLSTTSI